jgi:hypothetical protein
MTSTRAVIGAIAVSIQMQSDKLVLTAEELAIIQSLSPEELAEVETLCRRKAAKWLASARQVRAIVDDRRNVA